MYITCAGMYTTSTGMYNIGAGIRLPVTGHFTLFFNWESCKRDRHREGTVVEKNMAIESSYIQEDCLASNIDIWLESYPNIMTF
jgi:hypothetical protein